MMKKKSNPSKTCNPLSIEDIDWGISSRVENTIYVNKNLEGYPELRERLIEHELQHSDSHTKKDFFLDLGIKELDGIRLLYWNFVLTYPKSWVAFLPIKRIKGEWILNPNLFIAWLIFLVTFKIAYYFIGRVL